MGLDSRKRTCKVDGHCPSEPLKCYAASPISQFQVCAEHAAEMGEMGNARFCPEYAISQFDESEHDYKKPCRHRDWREKEHHDAAWVENAKGKQHTKNPTRCTNGRVYAGVPRRSNSS